MYAVTKVSTDLLRLANGNFQSIFNNFSSYSLALWLWCMCDFHCERL